MCSRNYAKWRTSWSKAKRLRKQKQSMYYKQIKESLPLTLKGHRQVCILWMNHKLFLSPLLLVILKTNSQVTISNLINFEQNLYYK